MDQFLLGVALLLFGGQIAQESDFVRSVEQTRGGRHWVDRKTDPPKSPQESAACFQIEPGCRIELVASEPLVFDPVAIEFDSAGRMFVAEYCDYPVGPKDPAAPRLSRVVMLQDLDHDRVMDQRTVFAENLAFCHSLMPLMDGILACTETEILFLRDSNGDGRSDVREVWFSGFTPAHPQMQIGCPRWGYDNRIWLTYGPGNVQCRRPGFETAEPVRLGGNDFRFDPLTMKFESVTGLGQFGNTFDRDGHRFFCTNRNPIMTEVLPLSALQRNPFAGLSTGHVDVGPAGEETRVYPLVDMKSNYLSHAGTHTSACGVTAYRGDLFSESFQRSVFVCEPVGHLVTRSVIQEHGATLTAVRAREKADFLASTDTWFRPASLTTGPDGELLLADMYRLWVEHPKFVPDDVAAKMDWRAGEDRGRIWRIVPDGAFVVRPIPSVESDANLVSLLRDSNGWRRLLGQRLIVEAQRNLTGPAVRALLNDHSASPWSRMQALWTLDGLRCCGTEDLKQCFADQSPLLRRDAIRIAAERFPKDPEMGDQILALCTDPVPEVRLHAFNAAGVISEVRGIEIPGSAAAAAAEDSWLRSALLSSARNCSGSILKDLVSSWQNPGSSAAESPTTASVNGTSADQKQTREDRRELLIRLSTAVAARGDADELAGVLSLMSADDLNRFWWQSAILAGLGHGLPSAKSGKVPSSLSALMSSANDSPWFKDSLTVKKLMDRAIAMALAADQDVSARTEAISLLPFQSPEVLSDTSVSLLSLGQPPECQIAALDVIRRTGRADLVMILMDRWSTLSPAVRSRSLDLVLNRKETILDLLKRMATGDISASVLSIDQRLRLLQSQDDEIRKPAGELFGGTVSANRKEVAEQYADSLNRKASAEAGARVFEKTCAKCHRIGSVGHQVGPDISDTRSRARDALLYDILDPNRRVDPQYTDYIAVTLDGRTLNGLLVSETPEMVVLRQPEGQQQSIRRSDLEELRSTTRSLMPEGVEKDIDVQQMADLLEFLKTR